MPEQNPDHAWEFFGKNDPYWAVLTRDRYRNKAFGQAERQEFFLSGEKHIDWVFSMVQKHFDPGFNPVKGLDFGCGVGRLLLPMSRRCGSAVGVDVSEGMLKEAEKNCRAEGVKNVSLVKGDDNCSALKSEFDFINSFIVFQHIPCDRGVKLFERLLQLLSAGGVAAVHLTYSRSFYPINGNELNYQPSDERNIHGGRYHLSGIKQAIKRRLRRGFRPGSGKSSKPSDSIPEMQMNSYILNPIFQILQQNGVREMHLAFSDHSTTLGVVLFFKRGPGKYLFPALCE